MHRLHSLHTMIVDIIAEAGSSPGKTDDLMTTTIPSLITYPSSSLLASCTLAVLMILQLLPMRAFLSMMHLLTWVFAPEQVSHQPLITCSHCSCPAFKCLSVSNHRREIAKIACT